MKAIDKRAMIASRLGRVAVAGLLLAGLCGCAQASPDAPRVAVPPAGTPIRQVARTYLEAITNGQTKVIRRMSWDRGETRAALSWVSSQIWFSKLTLSSPYPDDPTTLAGVTAEQKPTDIVIKFDVHNARRELPQRMA